MLGVLDAEVLIFEFLAVDGFTASAVAFGEVSTLDHELGDDPVEARTLIAEAILAGGELIEISGCLGDLVAVETHEDAAKRLSTLLDVEVDLVSDGGVSHVDGGNGMNLTWLKWNGELKIDCMMFL